MIFQVQLTNSVVVNQKWNHQYNNDKKNKKYFFHLNFFLLRLEIKIIWLDRYHNAHIHSQLVTKGPLAKGSEMEPTAKKLTKKSNFFKNSLRGPSHGPYCPYSNKLSIDSNAHSSKLCIIFFSKFKSRWQNKVIFMAIDTPSRLEIVLFIMYTFSCILSY